MLRMPIAAVIVCLATVCCVRAGDDPSAVNRNADPTFAVARMDADGSVVITTFRRVPKTEVRTEKQTKDGIVKEVTVAATVMSPELKEQRVSLKDLRVYDAEGKAVDPQTLPDRLKKETVVVLSTDGEKVDARFLTAVKEGTLILAPPVVRVDANPEPKQPPEKR